MVRSSLTASGASGSRKAWKAALRSPSRCCWMRASISSRSRKRSSARTLTSAIPHFAISPRMAFRRNSADSPSGMSWWSICLSNQATSVSTDQSDRNTHVSDTALRHQPTNGLSQEFGGLAERDVLVVDLLVQPGDQRFNRPVTRTAEGHHLLVQGANEIGLRRILQEGGLHLAFCANVNQARFARRAKQGVVAVRKRGVLGAELPGVFEQECALELKELAILADAEQGHDKVELPFPRRGRAGLARPAECLLRLAYDFDRFRDDCFSLGALDATGELVGFLLVERNNDGDFALRGVNASFARQGRHFNLRNRRVNLRRWDLHGLGLNAERQDALRDRNNNPLGLRPGKAVAFQGLAQLRQHF